MSVVMGAAGGDGSREKGGAGSFELPRLFKVGGIHMSESEYIKHQQLERIAVALEKIAAKAEKRK